MRKAVTLLCLLGMACSAPVSTGGGTTSPSTSSSQQPRSPTNIWPVKTRSHVDLWLHGYAMLLVDTATPPVFRRGYREKIRGIKSQRGITTLLDNNRERLQQRLAVSQTLVNGQFAPLYFANYDQMRQVINQFLTAEGNPNATSDATLRQFFIVLASSYQTAADREWLRLFAESLDDENRKFYQEYWNSENTARFGQVRTADSLWQATYRQKFTRYLNNTQQENGDFILALTLGGEGRTVNFSSRQNAIASTMPEQEPQEAFYVFAHEATSNIVATAVNDNTTPNDQRMGVAAKHITAGTVRAGAMLLQKIAPELVPGYTRYYLMQSGQSTTGDINARLIATYPLPDVIRQAIDRQLEVVLGGI